VAVKSPGSPSRDSEEAFIRDWLRVLDEARQLRLRGERGRYAIPRGLLGLLGEDTVTEKPGVVLSRIEPPKSAPINLKPDWMWVPAAYRLTQVKTVIKAILRAHGDAVQVRRVIEELEHLRSDVSAGTVANIGTALSKEGLISRGDDGWRLVSPESAPELADGYLYGPVAVFGDSDIAWFRREAILHLLRVMPSGLQAQQIVGHLESVDWIPDPKG
jgi:hypothetical protein